MVATVRVKRTQHRKLPTTITGPSIVKVGFPEGQSQGDIVDRAVWNHYGTSRGIPSRPFLMNAVRKNKRTYVNALKSSAAQILNGDTTMTMILNRLGILAQGHIQEEITNLQSPENAASTIARKGSSNPLIDTGEMRAAVTWKVDHR